jgi:hypothetical protein
MVVVVIVLLVSRYSYEQYAYYLIIVITIIRIMTGAERGEGGVGAALLILIIIILIIILILALTGAVRMHAEWVQPFDHANHEYDTNHSQEFYGVKPEWVEPFDLVPIIDTKGVHADEAKGVKIVLGTCAAKTMCEELGVQVAP